MPRNMMKSNLTEMDSEMALNGRIGDYERSHETISRSRGYNLEEDNLKYLSSEEQSALLFFEETLKSFQDDLTINGSSLPRFFDENASVDSEPEDIIDLVPAAHETSELKEEAAQDSGISCDDHKPEQKNSPPVTYSPPGLSPTAMDLPRGTEIPTEITVSRQKLLGAVPTPVVIAEHISKTTMDNGNLSPVSPKEDRLVESRKNAATSPPPVNEGYFSYPLPASARITQYPNNIIVNKLGKEYNKTISRAAVNVQDRKAQVLANLHGTNMSEEVENRMHRSHKIGCEQSTSFRDAPSQQARYEAMSKLHFIKETPVQVETPAVVETDQATNEHKLKSSPTKPVTNGYDNINKVLKSEPSPFIPAGKTIVFPATKSPADKFTRKIPTHSVYEHSPSRLQNDIKRSVSLPRPSGFRPQGITVQFSGRGATEEARKQALRKLGLLKETS